MADIQPPRYRRVAMRQEEMRRRKRWKRREVEDALFGAWILVVFVGCPVLFVLDMLGVLPS